MVLAITPINSSRKGPAHDAAAEVLENGISDRATFVNTEFAVGEHHYRPQAGGLGATTPPTCSIGWCGR